MSQEPEPATKAAGTQRNTVLSAPVAHPEDLSAEALLKNTSKTELTVEKRSKENNEQESPVVHRQPQQPSIASESVEEKHLHEKTEIKAIASEEQKQEVAEKHPHRNHKKLAVTATILIMIALAASVVFVYYQGVNNVEERVPNQTQDTVIPNTTIIDDKEIDESTIDSLLNELDAAADDLDASSQQIEDQSLSNEAIGIE